MKRTLLGALAATAIGMHLLGATAQAQYPQQLGALICTTGGTTQVVTGSSTGLTATLTNASGAPIAGQAVSFTSQLPNGTVINQGNGVTNANGTVTVNLNVGTTPGTITLVASSGALGCTSTIGSSAPAPVAQVAGSTFVPPATGDAGLLDGSGSTDKSLMTLLLAPIILAGGLLARKAAAARR